MNKHSPTWKYHGSQHLKQCPFCFFSVELCFLTLTLTNAAPRVVASLVWERLQAVELQQHSAGAPRPCKYPPGQANACSKPTALIKNIYKEQRPQIPLFVSFPELLVPIKLFIAVKLFQPLLHCFSKARSNLKSCHMPEGLF